MTTSIVTGVGGFIGSHLAQTLLQEGHQVIGVDHFNDYYDPTLKYQNLAVCRDFSGFQLVDGDICELNWADWLGRAEFVYHQAAQAGVRASWGDSFRLYTERNINATQVLLEAAKGVPHLKRVVLASSSSVYGNAETLPTGESVCPAPVSPYGITKLAAESLGWLYHHNFGVPVTALRYFTVYGPRQRPDMAFHKFMKGAIAHQPILIYGDGHQTRDYTFVSDAIAANLAAATIPEAIGKVFNIGGGSRVGLLEVLTTLEDIMGQPLNRHHGENAKGDARHTGADIRKAQAILGYQPTISLMDGLTQQWNWIRSLYES